MNMMSIMSMVNQLKQASNPQQMLTNMFQQQAGNNPIAQNAMDMFKNNDVSGLEELARKIGKNKGVDVDAMVNQIRNGVGR